MDGAARDFWAQVDICGHDECWEWKGTRFKKGGEGGYGRYRGVWRAHRVAFELAYGRTPPDDVLVLHSCDNPPCCNPRHLHLGTQGQNMSEKRRRGRAGKCWGEQHGMAVLTDAQCEDIRAKRLAGQSCARIHREGYEHVSYGSVWTVATGRTRAHGSRRMGPRISQSGTAIRMP
jgi:hypothetical protein